MLDVDLAELYGVPVKRLNEQVRRNVKRFPSDFMLQLTRQEYEALRSQFATLLASPDSLHKTCTALAMFLGMRIATKSTLRRDNVEITPGRYFYERLQSNCDQRNSGGIVGGGAGSRPCAIMQ
jgi:hypothetical protein